MEIEGERVGNKGSHMEVDSSVIKRKKWKSAKNKGKSFKM
jgi:hypothetical protein